MTSITLSFFVTDTDYQRVIDAVNAKTKDGTIFSTRIEAVMHRTIGSQRGEIVAHRITIDINSIEEILAQVAALVLFDGDVEFAQRIIV